MSVITRFAPSPTGFMHIGGIRTALFAYLWALKNKGTFILRIEDTDTERVVAGSVEHIQKSLRWLGIDWDYGPDKPGSFGSCIQSERLPSYIEFAHKLIEKGLAYPDPYTEEEIAAFRARAEAEKRPFLYRHHRPKTFETWDGTKPLRFKVANPKRYHWEDAVRGKLEAGEEALDDFILIKSDGYPTYNFAHIIDDHHMKVTHILRADEFISSTPRFLSLYEALGFEHPQFVTLPPILRDDKTKKLGKRDGAKDILEYKVEGYLPEALINSLALLGWNPGTDQEIFSREELVQAFDLKKIQKAGAVFNLEKLNWFNKKYIEKLDTKSFLEHAAPFIPAEFHSLTELLAKVAPLLQEKISYFAQIPELFQTELAFIAAAGKYETSKLNWKGESDSGITKSHLRKILDLLAPIADGDFTKEKIKEVIWPYAEEKGRGNVLWPMRYALSGQDRSPDPFVISDILGREETLKRLTFAHDSI